MTSHGSPYARLRRALDHRNVTEALSAAADLPHVGLVDALELVLLLCDRSPERYERAALRWHVRFCRETADVSLADGGQAVLALLVLLPTRREQAAHALADLLYRRGLERACEALNSWARRSVT